MDPSYHGDKISLSRLDIAFSMVKSMSVDHAFAPRAHIFLQQLLSFMDKSLINSRQQNPQSNNTWRSATLNNPNNQNTISPLNHLAVAATIGSLATTANPADIPAVQQPVSIANGLPLNGVQHLGEGATPDLYALFDYTQDLTENLGSRLDTYENGVGTQAMWNWEGNGFTGPPAQGQSGP
jgi:hypothetical protein